MDPLSDFARNRSGAAFRILVREHSPLVYGTALRKLGGDRAAAQDITQEVFTLLARKATGLENVVLTGWLYRQTCRRAANHVRSEVRRKSREMVSLEPADSASPADSLDARMLARELDNALLSLPATDRDALLLRFFEGKEYREIGKALGIGEDAVRKRVTRAVERLGGILKRKGIMVGSVSLTTAMEGFGAEQVSVEMISRISTTALHAGGTGASLGTLLTPIVAGALATSLVTGPVILNRDAPVEPATLTAGPRRDRTTRDSNALPAEMSLEQILTEIERVNSSPATAISALRLKIVLSKIGIGRVPAFIELGNERLNQAQRGEIYQPLLNLWWDQDPEATMTFILFEDIDSRIGAIGGHYLVGELFRQWSGRDPRASEAWLLRHWNHPTLAKGYSQGAFRNFLSMWIAGEWFTRSDVDGLFEFAARMPTIRDQASALEAIAGLAPMHSRWSYSESHKTLWKKFHRGIEAFPDEASRRALVRGFWKNLGESQPGQVTSIQAYLAPSERFDVALGLLGVHQVADGEAKSLSGGISILSKPITDRNRREATALEAGLAAGFSQRETLTEIAKVILETLEPADQLSWLDAHRDEVDVDPFILEKARSTDGDAMGWALRVSDPDLRRTLCRGLFLRLVALNVNSARSYLSTGGAPADLIAEFQSILEDAP